MYAKNGAPMRAVIAPTGNSDGIIIVLANKSVITIKHPPIIMQIGITYLCLAPIILLTRWGTIKSTKPIIPLNATAHPVNIAEKISKCFFTIFVFTPTDFAWFSPKDKMSISVQ